MLANFKKLFTGLSFLRLKSRQLIWFKLWFPLIMTAAIMGLYLFLPVQPSLFGASGIVERIGFLLSVLIGFYIAALSAVASFPRDMLDEPMKGAPVNLKYKRKGKEGNEELTRRRFLCVLFGYCSIISMLLLLMGLMTELVLPSLSATDPTIVIYKLEFNFIWWLKILWIIVYFFFLSSLFIVTMLGLHYLVDRMHRE